MPSTTMSLPGKLWGRVRESIASASGEFEFDGSSEDGFEELALAGGAPELELGVEAGGDEAGDLTRGELTAQASDDRGVAAIEAIGESEERGADIDDFSGAG